MQVLTMLVGTFGFISGMIKAATSPGDTALPDATVLHGFGEALHNVGLSLGLVIFAGIAGAVGLARLKRDACQDGSLVDPFVCPGPRHLALGLAVGDARSASLVSGARSRRRPPPRGRT